MSAPAPVEDDPEEYVEPVPDDRKMAVARLIQLLDDYPGRAWMPLPLLLQVEEVEILFELR